MSEQKLHEQPSDTLNPAADTQPLAKKPKKRIGLWISGILAGIFLLTALGSLAGYYAGIQMRKAAEENNRALAASLQYQLGVENFLRGDYNLAKQRFEYVIQLNPAYPGVLEKMAEIAIIVNATATPTPEPEITPLPTLDLSGVESLLAQARQFLIAQDWDSAILALDAMRKENPSFKTLEVDGLYYLALRNRGINQIQKFGKLEQGMFDIVLMSRIGPVDKDSRDASEWAGYYIYGASWFGIDWARVIKDLYVVHANYPYLLDQNNVPATFRYWTALYKYGVQLVQANEAKNACSATEYYEQAWALNQAIPNDDLHYLNKAKKLCIEQSNNAPYFTVDALLPDGATTIPYSFGITGMDPDGDPINISFLGGNLADYGLSYDNGTVTGTPTAVGTATFTLSINDDKGATTTTEFTINIPN